MVSCVVMQGSQYRPTKIPLESVRAFEFGEVYCYPPIDSKVVFLRPSSNCILKYFLVSLCKVALKDEADIDPNDPESVLEHLSKLVLIIYFFSPIEYISNCYFYHKTVTPIFNHLAFWIE